MSLEKDKTYIVPYPFHEEFVDIPAEEGMFQTTESWIPGCDNEYNGVDGYSLTADKMGEMHLTIVDIHKPGKYPTRVFYTRKWKDPNGKVFGKNSLHICVTEKFKRLLKGYWLDYTISDKYYEDEES